MLGEVGDVVAGVGGDEAGTGGGLVADVNGRGCGEAAGAGVAEDGAGAVVAEGEGHELQVGGLVGGVDLVDGEVLALVVRLLDDGGEVDDEDLCDTAETRGFIETVEALPYSQRQQATNAITMRDGPLRSQPRSRRRGRWC